MSDVLVSLDELGNLGALARSTPPTPGVISRPRPTVAQMTDEQFAAHLTSLPSQFARDCASMVRNFGRAFPTR